MRVLQREIDRSFLLLPRRRLVFLLFLLNRRRRHHHHHHHTLFLLLLLLLIVFSKISCIPHLSFRFINLCVYIVILAPLVSFCSWCKIDS